MTSLRWSAALVAAVVCSGCGGPSPRPAPAAPADAPSGRLDDATAARVEQVLEAQRRELRIPGLAIAVVVDGEIAYLSAAGVRDVERKLPATADTVFPIGSCTKAFTALALAMSQDEGLLELDDRPAEHLPYFEMADPEADAIVTLRDMLSHRTGLRAKADLAATPGVLDREHYIRAATSARPVVPPRTAFQYSNAMYTAAGEIAARVHGTTWERVIEQEIFGPLHMSSSLASLAHLSSQPEHAVGYELDPDSGTWRPVPPSVSLEAMAPAGAIASTARDMARWLRMLTNGGRTPSGRLVSPQRFRELTTPHIAIDESMSYALGWVTYSWRGLTVIEHNGGGQGISALVSFIPERRTGFVLLANISPTRLTAIGTAGELFWPVLLGDEAPAPRPAPAPTPSPPQAAPGPASTADLPTASELVARMTAAAGGTRALEAHTSFELRADKSYDNHGVEAALTVRARAPARCEERERWTAAGIPIGRVRTYFDGERGGQETTFGQDAIHDADANALARRRCDLHPLLHLRDLYRDIRVASRGVLDGHEVFVLELTPERGPAVTLHVAADTALIRRRDTAGSKTRYGDYRLVDGEMVPFRSVTEGYLGTVTTVVRDIRFNVPIPDDAFAPSPGGTLR